jgi:hypothetical protein
MACSSSGPSSRTFRTSGIPIVLLSISQANYDAALPVLDRQLGMGGLHLAAYLDTAFAPTSCPAH